MYQLQRDNKMQYNIFKSKGTVFSGRKYVGNAMYIISLLEFIIYVNILKMLLRTLLMKPI